ncbi:MAG: hypothetical protein K0U54_05780 [Bacteroidetes bacterium]|nr:hypothetical protein [Bacteroidota bacterium]
MKIIYKAFLFNILAIGFNQVLASTQVMDLNDFFSDPSVSISQNGESATLTEDQNLNSILLSNDPFFGGSGIAVTPDLIGISFDYEFSSPQGNIDNFFAWVFDADTFTPIHQISLSQSNSGSIFFHLASLANTVTTLGLEFQLNSFSTDREITSVVDISRVRINRSSPVPIPQTLPLFLIGLFFMTYYLKIKQYSFN